MTRRQRWGVIATVLVGMAAGLGLYTLGYARGYAYLAHYHRKAQFLANFIEAENSMGFHADQEPARILAKSIDYARRGQMALHGQEPPPVTNPARAAATATR